MKNLKNPSLLHEIEHEGLGEGQGHWSYDDYVSEVASIESRIFYVAGVAEGFVLYRDVGGEVEIMNLAVRRKGEGHGRALLEGFLATLFGPLSGSTHTVFLEVAAGNTAARALYEKLGFEKTGLRKSYYRNGDDAVTYARPRKKVSDDDHNV
ncbi:MAG: GNAT family N-acetyltransferase [Bdellovibrionota bacterium]